MNYITDMLLKRNIQTANGTKKGSERYKEGTSKKKEDKFLGVPTTLIMMYG
jgi:hypothetical protein